MAIEPIVVVQEWLDGLDSVFVTGVVGICQQGCGSAVGWERRLKLSGGRCLHRRAMWIRGMMVRLESSCSWVMSARLHGVGPTMRSKDGALGLADDARRLVRLLPVSVGPWFAAG